MNQRTANQNREPNTMGTRFDSLQLVAAHVRGRKPFLVLFGLVWCCLAFFGPKKIFCFVDDARAPVAVVLSSTLVPGTSCLRLTLSGETVETVLGPGADERTLLKQGVNEREPRRGGQAAAREAAVQNGALGTARPTRSKPLAGTLAPPRKRWPTLISANVYAGLDASTLKTPQGPQAPPLA
jgi:hypothetical protein